MRELSVEEGKKIQMSLLKSLHIFCKENNITYYLYYGSLIGAVRHHGFIPWDDDIDVAMKRPDYTRFVEEFNLNRSDEYRVISSDNTAGFCYAFAKLSDTNTVVVEDITVKQDMGINIDVFPLDYLPEDKKVMGKHIKRIQNLHNLLNLKLTTVRKGRAAYKNMILILAHIALKPVSIKKLVNKIVMLSKKYDHIPDPDKLANLSLMTYKSKEIQDVQDVAEGIEVTFENENFYIPIGYDNILKKLYGDYMVLPPVDKRITHHHSKAYYK